MYGVIRNVIASKKNLSINITSFSSKLPPKTDPNFKICSRVSFRFSLLHTVIVHCAATLIVQPLIEIKHTLDQLETLSKTSFT